MRTCRSVSRCAASSHLFEIAFPATSAQTAGLVEAERLCRHCAQREIDGVALCLQAVATHDFCAGLFVDIYICASHTLNIHITGNKERD